MTDVDKNTENLTDIAPTVDNISNVQPNVSTAEDSVSKDASDVNRKSEVKTCGVNLENEVIADTRVVEILPVQDNDMNKHDQERDNKKPCKKDTSKGISEKYNESKDQQEEDVPESFFDDFMNEDFMEGLNVVDAWDGDDVVRQNIEEINDKNVKKEKSMDQLPLHKEDKTIFIQNTDLSKKKKHKDKVREKDKTLGGISRSTSRSRKRRLRRSKSKEYKLNEISSRRDPNKTQRDILKDKDKCEKDKTTKLIYEKLKVVETGLVPPGTEMEIDALNGNKNNNTKLEDGEILSEQDVVEKNIPTKNKSVERRKEYKPGKPEQLRRSRSKGSINRIPLRRYSPEVIRRIRSRSRSLKRRLRERSRSLERRLERRRRTRSRSRSSERRYRYRSPPRKTSPLAKRNHNLFKEIDLLKAKLYADMPIRSRNIEFELTQGVRITAPPHAILPTPQNFNNPMQFPQQAPVPVPNPNFPPIQPVPPPQQIPMELDQQFFIGQPAFDPNPYGMQMQQPQMQQPPMQQPPMQQPPMQQPQMIHNPVMQPIGPPEIQPNFQQNWPMPQPQPEFFNNPNMGINMNIASLEEHLGFSGNPMHIPQNVQHQLPFVQTPPQNISQPPIFNMKENEDEVFAKLFADNKITLSDYLSVTAKSTDNTNPIDIQKKIKVISHCQEALSEINGTVKATGKFFLRKSQKPPIKLSGAEGLSPFKKVPAIKFQYTTFMKSIDDKPTLVSSLNKLLFKLGVDTQFEEVHPSPIIKNDQKESPTKATPPVQQKIKWTTHTSTQTNAVTMIDFGCQVSIEDVPPPSPVKTILKKQSLAKLTPAQLLAQAEEETTAPPPPKWTTSEGIQNTRRRGDLYRDAKEMEEMDRRSRMMGGFPQPSRNLVPGWNPGNPYSNVYDRSPDPPQHPYFGPRR